MPPAEIRIVPVQSKKEFCQFLKLPYRLYQDDPHWVPPLLLERREILHPKKNPFYRHAEVQLFLAQRGKKNVGRLSAQIDREYEKKYGERVGHFGFFECENSAETARALFGEAESYLRKWGATRCLGPYSFSINEESGLLIEGFDKPLMTMIPYNPPYYADLLEHCGYRKIKDLFAWFYRNGEIPAESSKIAAEVSQYPGLKIRTLDVKNFRRDLQIMIDVYNSAWSENWGFLPMTPEEVEKTAKDMKMLLVPEAALIAELAGKPIAIALSLPNLYEIVRGMKGRLLPFNWIRLLWRIKRKKYKSGRLLLLGIRKEQQGTMLGGFLSVMLYVEMHRRGLSPKIEWAELSWTLEDNHKVNAGIEFMGGKKYKTFRIYEKLLNG